MEAFPPPFPPATNIPPSKKKEYKEKKRTPALDVKGKNHAHLVKK